MANTILLVEDEENVRKSLTLVLQADAYNVHAYGNPLRALEQVHLDEIDLVIIDIVLPDMNGFELCRTIRERSMAPILIVSAKDAPHDIVAGLEAGADDYLVKPIQPSELTARIRAHLRRVKMLSRKDQQPSIMIKNLEIRPSEGMVFLAGKPVKLTKTEFKILCELSNPPGTVVSREKLLEKIWGYDWFGDGRLVDSHILRLRRKIEIDESNPELLITVRGLGYKLSTN